MEKDLDVLIVGAGLSGIDAAYRIQSACPNKTYALLEAREAIGGTWDLFKYPGIRSDSDMYTLGFPFYPWKNPKAIADGPAILSYIKETAAHFGIDKNIRFKHKVIQASWSSEAKLWTVTIAKTAEEAPKVLRCKFLFMTSGYYNFDQGYLPKFNKLKNFKGDFIHPQHWNPSIDYTNKKIIVIGSGATAVTLVPELAKKAAHVTMLQRSPSYMLNIPSKDVIANFLRKILPSKFAYNLVKWKNVFLGLSVFNVSRKWPNFSNNLLINNVLKEIKDETQREHFTPKYKPWDQRLCLIPDGDFFKAIRDQKASIVTDTIQEFKEDGLLLQSGKTIEADIIVSATGLNLQLLGGMEIDINGTTVDTSELFCYKGVLFSDIPNMAIAIGYTNASWTLKSDLNCQFVTRLLNFMDENDKTVCTPRFDHTKFNTERLLDFDAGYVKRAEDKLPKQGSAKPWKVHQNYIKDTIALKYSSIDDENLEFI